MNGSGAAPDTVHAPLARWAAERLDTPAIDDGERAWTFAALHAEVMRRADGLAADGAPIHHLVDPQAPTVEQLIDFLATVASGRCAAVGDPDWPAATLAAVQATLAALPSPLATEPGPTTPFYIGHTSGSTGLPKGYRRDHRSWTESFRAALDTFGPDAAGPILAPGRISHSLFLFGMLLGLWTGAGVVVQPRFSAARALDTLRRGRATCLVAVPSQLLMLIEHAARRSLAPVEATRLVLISGAPWARPRTPELQALFPNARLIEFYGASETSFIAWQPADAATPAAVVGRPFTGVDVEIRDRPAPDPANPNPPGRIHVRSAMLFTDYVGQLDTATAAIRTVDARGTWLSVRDRGDLDDQGRLWLHGRENRMLVTQGKNLFPEEVEAVLEGRPGVRAASVLGRPDPIRGREVVAVIEAAPDTTSDTPPPTAADLAAACRATLEPHKVPRRWWLAVGDWPRTPSGKIDHGAVAARLAAALDGEREATPGPVDALAGSVRPAAATSPTRADTPAASARPTHADPWLRPLS